MKIAFIGTHGVGKTTLCYELAALLKKRGFDSDLVKEVARACPLPINQETNLRAQLWILHSQIAAEVELEARHEVVVCDRSVIDNYAYLRHAAGPQPAIERLVRDWISTYHLLLRVPGRYRATNDCVRDLDPIFQSAIDRAVHELLHAWELDYEDLGGLARNRWIRAAESAALKLLESPQPTGVSERPSDQLDLFVGS